MQATPFSSCPMPRTVQKPSDDEYSPDSDAENRPNVAAQSLSRSNGEVRNVHALSAQDGDNVWAKRVGVAYYGYRWYDPLTGRWPSRDPMEENWATGEFNEYAYIISDAINGTDFLGLERQEVRHIPRANRGPAPNQVPTRIDRIPFKKPWLPTPMLPTGGGPNQTGDSGGTGGILYPTRSPWLPRSRTVPPPPPSPGPAIGRPRGFNPYPGQNGRISNAQDALGAAIVAAAESAQIMAAKSNAKTQCEILALQVLVRTDSKLMPHLVQGMSSMKHWGDAPGLVIPTTPGGPLPL
ncbi:MAG: hypothetical protein K9N23_12810 [Akkermansiaceae bacterium]|nr:hypothetical protein [Akkermansiaceae bacterium]